MPNWSRAAFDMLPHGYCLSWQPHLLWLHAVSDLVTALAYYSIPVTLLRFAWRRRDLQFRWLLVLFGVFIMACGTTHVMSLWNLWVPDYLATGIVKAITAVASVTTAAVLYPLIPKALALPGPAQWEAVNASLHNEISERRDAEAEVRRLNAELEQRVSERTAELEAANCHLADANRTLSAREADSHQNRELLHSIIDNSTAVIFVKNLDGRYLLANRLYAELFHVGQEALVGGTDYDVFPRERADAYRDADRKVLAAGCALQTEEIVPQDDGLHTYLSVKFPLVDAAGRPYAVCGIATDITERKRAEEQFQRVVEAAPNAIVLADRNGHITLINAQTEKLFGYAREELIGKSVDILVPAEARAGHRGNRDKYLANPSVRAMGADRELRGVHRDGHEIPIEIGLNPIQTEDGHHVLASITDITARKQAEAERLARQAAESASRAKSDFLATMSHELRTPLNAILGYTQILKRDAGLTERQTGGLDTIQQSGQHLLTLINDVLDLSKIEARKLDLHPAPVELPALLRVVADIVRVKAEEKSLLFAYEAPSDLPRVVLADEKRLRQVLLNLLSNAVKFTDRGRVTFTVQSLAGNGGSARLRFEVRDTGVGITSEQLGRLFQPFEQVGDVQHRAAGTGLGLAISQQLVHLMGSEIDVESHPAHGSRFGFELSVPLAEAAPARAHAQIPTGYQGVRRKVLITDDVVANRALLAELLGGLGFELCEACDGAQALEQVRTAAPDLVLMDLVMPVMDGPTAIRCIRAEADKQRLPIIAVSASTNYNDDHALSLEAGANAFFLKPIDHDALLTKIGELLGLTWIRAATAPAQAAPDGAAATMSIPPRAEMTVLHQYALAGNMRALRQRAAHLIALDERYRPFADTLCRLAAGYQSKAILALVEGHLQQESL